MPTPGQESDIPVVQVINGVEKDLGGFSVRRVLPVAKQRMVGPFVFFDHFGPAEFPPGKGINVRPHPHIGLATITYLFSGEIMHRDSLGYTQPIQAGAVNLMTAGRGIVHSERSDNVDGHTTLHGIQSWMALPTDMEVCEPDFVHYAASVLPQIEIEGCTITLIMGSAFGQVSPVTCYSPTLYFECAMRKGAILTMPVDAEELAIYIVEGQVEICDKEYAAHHMVVVEPSALANIRARSESRLMVIGGDTLGERLLWWNFVSSSAERIQQAKLDWQSGRFAKVPGETEFIPLPEN